MKKPLMTAALALTALLARAQDQRWEFEPTHSAVRFSIPHFGISETEGQFHKFTGTIAPKGNDFAGAPVTFTLDAASIDTDDPTRDGHLKSPDFFDAAKYPTLAFQGKLVKATGDQSAYQLVGKFTMHGVTKPLTLAVRYNGLLVKDLYGASRAGFKVTGSLNRQDYGLVWNKTLDTGGLAVGNDVALVANIELLKK